MRGSVCRAACAGQRVRVIEGVRELFHPDCVQRVDVTLHVLYMTTEICYCLPVIRSQ